MDRGGVTAVATQNVEGQVDSQMLKAYFAFGRRDTLRYQHDEPDRAMASRVRGYART
jgi:hypothetical protein